MAPTGWTTPGQREFLISSMPEYLASQKAGRLSSFWTPIFAAFFAKFPVVLPVHEKMPQINENDTSEEKRADGERSAHGHAVQARQEQIQNWFRNHSKVSKRRRRAGLNDFVQTGRKPKRIHKLIEIYSKHYFDIKIRPLVEQRLEAATPAPAEGGAAENPREKNKRRLALRHLITQECWAAETDEVRNKIEQLHEGEKKVKEEEDKLESSDEDGEEELSAQAYQNNIDDFPRILKSRTEHWSRKTGWVIFTVVGGPRPSSGGAIEVLSIESGTLTPEGNSFSEVAPEECTKLLEAFNKYAHIAFSPEIRTKRSLQPAQAVNSDVSAQMLDPATTPSEPSADVAADPKTRSVATEDSGSDSDSSAPTETTSTSDSDCSHDSKRIRIGEESEYDRLRDAHIARNQKLLKDMGLERVGPTVEERKKAERVAARARKAAKKERRIKRAQERSPRRTRSAVEQNVGGPPDLGSSALPVDSQSFPAPELPSFPDGSTLPSGHSTPSATQEFSGHASPAPETSSPTPFSTPKLPVTSTQLLTSVPASDPMFMPVSYPTHETSLPTHSMPGPPAVNQQKGKAQAQKGKPSQAPANPTVPARRSGREVIARTMDDGTKLQIAKK